MALPRFIVLQSIYNKKYLRYTNEDDETHEFLQSSGEQILSPYVKFEVVAARTAEKDDLVHLKCCLNNKYLVCSEESDWITAKAERLEEDQSKRSCTLFEPIYVDDGSAKNTPAVRFRHVFRDRYACVTREAPPYDYCLFLDDSENSTGEIRDAYKFIAWESLFVLPKYVAFKGDDGKYISARKSGKKYHLQFSSTKRDDPDVVNEIVTAGDGNIYIKSVQLNKFWRRRSGRSHWIWADLDGTTDAKDDALFEAVRVHEDLVALRNLGDRKFCRRLPTGFMMNSCLTACDSVLSTFSQLKVEEVVFERKIHKIRYHLRDSRIYNQRIVVQGTSSTENKTESETCSMKVKLSFKDYKMSLWKIGVSLKKDGKAAVEIDCVPKIVGGGKVETYSGEFQTGIEFGKPKKEEILIETVYNVKVPARHRVVVKATARAATIAVPFSYSQSYKTYAKWRDVITEDRDDGMYSGHCFYDFNVEHKYEKLPDN